MAGVYYGEIISHLQDIEWKYNINMNYMND